MQINNLFKPADRERILSAEHLTHLKQKQIDLQSWKRNTIQYGASICGNFLQSKNSRSIQTFLIKTLLFSTSIASNTLHNNLLGRLNISNDPSTWDDETKYPTSIQHSLSIFSLFIKGGSMLLAQSFDWILSQKREIARVNIENKTDQHHTNNRLADELHRLQESEKEKRESALHMQGKIIDTIGSI